MSGKLKWVIIISFFSIKNILPRRLQIYLRRMLLYRTRLSSISIWPIYKKAGNAPKCFLGWPEKKKYSLVLRHDVETEEGCDRCFKLIEIEKKLGYRSSFFFIPLKYRVPKELIKYIVDNGFEIGVHGLKHDGRLFLNRNLFKKRAIRINQYIDKWGAVGFSAPSCIRNLEWIHLLNIFYDTSTFDTDPFEPQNDAFGSIFPKLISDTEYNSDFIELPYTLPQDFTLFILMKEKKIDIWLNKLEWIIESNGMALLNTHPDYMCFDQRKSYCNYSLQMYTDFLEIIKDKYYHNCWHALPREMAAYWRKITK